MWMEEQYGTGKDVPKINTLLSGFLKCLLGIFVLTHIPLMTTFFSYIFSLYIIISALYCFEAYTFIKALQKDKTLKKYELIEESREMFRKDLIKYNENHGIRGEVDWKKYESQLMVSK